MFFFIPRSRKSLLALMAVLSVACIVVTICTICLWAKDQQMLKEYGQPDFYTLSQGELKDGLIVKGTIDVALDYYSEKYRTGTGTSDKNEALYYIVPIYDVDGSGMITFKYLLTYEAEPEDYDVMNQVITDFWNNEAGLTSFNIDNAKIVNLSADNKQFFSEWTRNTEIWGEGQTFYDWAAETSIFGTDDKDEIASKFVPLMLRKTSTAGTDPLIIWVLAALSAVCVIIFVIVLLRKKPINGIIDNTGNPDVMRPQQ